MSEMQYEDLKVTYETEETPESHLLHVHIPEGFAKEHVGAKVEYDFGRVRIFGERSLGNNKCSRFNERYQIPSYCDINKIRGKFDGKIVTITMTKIPGLVPQQEPQTTEQEAPKPTVQETQPYQSTTEDNQDKKANDAEVKDQKGHQEGTSDQDSKSTVASKGEPEATNESMTQKGQEETHQKDEVTQVQSTGETSHETSTTQEATKESIRQKGQEEMAPKATVTSDAKLQTEENIEKQRIGEEETEEGHPKNTTDSVKPPEEKKRKKEDFSTTPEKKRKEEGKGSDTVESFSPKDDKEKGKEIINRKFGDDAEKESDKKAMFESTRTRIKDMAASTSQALTSLSKSFNEDKEKIIYMSAAVVVVALGVYASYKFRSSHRP